MCFIFQFYSIERRQQLFTKRILVIFLCTYEVSFVIPITSLNCTCIEFQYCISIFLSNGGRKYTTDSLQLY